MKPKEIIADYIKTSIETSSNHLADLLDASQVTITGVTSTHFHIRVLPSRGSTLPRYYAIKISELLG